MQRAVPQTTGIPCFYVDVLDDVEYFLTRQYDGSGGIVCPLGGRWHTGQRVIGRGPKDAFAAHTALYYADLTHSGWPDRCACGWLFPQDTRLQHGAATKRLGERTDINQTLLLCDFPAGAMYYADWMSQYDRFGPDGLYLAVKTPGGVWFVDSRASNCDMPGEYEHRCWVRHGDPKEPCTVTVDKLGRTCSAGAGSVQCGSYHGFLRSGHLVPG